MSANQLEGSGGGETPAEHNAAMDAKQSEVKEQPHGAKNQVILLEEIYRFLSYGHTYWPLVGRLLQFIACWVIFGVWQENKGDFEFYPYKHCVPSKSHYNASLCPDTESETPKHLHRAMGIVYWIYFITYNRGSLVPQDKPGALSLLVVGLTSAGLWCIYSFTIDATWTVFHGLLVAVAVTGWSMLMIWLIRLLTLCSKDSKKAYFTPKAGTFTERLMEIFEGDDFFPPIPTFIVAFGLFVLRDLFFFIFGTTLLFYDTKQYNTDDRLGECAFVCLWVTVVWELLLDLIYCHKILILNKETSKTFMSSVHLWRTVVCFLSQLFVCLFLQQWIRNYLDDNEKDVHTLGEYEDVLSSGSGLLPLLFWYHFLHGTFGALIEVLYLNGYLSHLQGGPNQTKTASQRVPQKELDRFIAQAEEARLLSDPVLVLAATDTDTPEEGADTHVELEDTVDTNTPDDSPRES